MILCESDLQRLVMQTFTIEQLVEALGVKRSDIEFIVYTHRLLLASEAPGGLVRRVYPRIDAYILALAFELVRLSGRRDEVCRALDRFLWWGHIDSEDIYREHRGQPKLTADERIEARRVLAAKYAADPGAARECFAPRELHEPWFLVGYNSAADGKLWLEAHRDDGMWLTSMMGIRSMLTVNVTRLMAEMDAKLAAIMEDA